LIQNINLNDLLHSILNICYRELSLFTIDFDTRLTLEFAKSMFKGIALNHKYTKR